jgi:hypothetical protein
MNPTNATVQTSSLRDRVAEPGHIGSQRAELLPHRCVDVATFAKTSASSLGSCNIGNSNLPGSLADQMEPLASAWHLSACDGHRATDGKAAFI